MKKAWAWLTGLFAPGNRKTSLAGAATLAAVAASCTGMAFGVVPVTPETVWTNLTGLATGVGLLAAKDASGKPTPPVVAEAIQVTAQAGAIASGIDPLYGPIKEAIEGVGQKASDEAKAQATMQAVAAIAALVSQAKVDQVEQQT